jgi:hypothetical protein
MRAPQPAIPLDDDDLDDGLPEPTPEEAAGIVAARRRTEREGTISLDEAATRLDAFIRTRAAARRTR